MIQTMSMGDMNEGSAVGGRGVVGLRTVAGIINVIKHWDEYKKSKS